MTQKRTGLPTAAYAESIAIAPQAPLVYVSGILANPIDGRAGEYGDTHQQAVSVLAKIKNILAQHDLDMGHIIQLRAFVVGVPEQGGRLDFPAFQQAYRTFFDVDNQDAKPVRTVVQVVGLPLPGTLVEVEVVATRS